MGPVNDKHQAPTNGLKLYDRAVIKSETGPTVVQIKEETIAINRDWVHNQACRLSHDIHVVSHSFITFNNLFKLITKISLFNKSLKFINLIAIKYRF